jgi:hypothetical protein
MVEHSSWPGQLPHVVTPPDVLPPLPLLAVLPLLLPPLLPPTGPNPPEPSQVAPHGSDAHLPAGQ